MLYLGIDLHRKQLTVSLRGEDGEVLMRRQVSTWGEEPRRFLEEVARRASESGYVAILEVCGFHDWLSELLPACGCREVVLVQAEKRHKRKTDRRDAHALSELLWVNREVLLRGGKVKGVRRVVPPTPEDRDDRRLTQLRRDAAADLTRVINGVRHILRRLNIEQHCPTKGIQTVTARRWLEKELKLSELDRLELDHLLARWKLLEQQIEALDGRIRERTLLHANAVVLKTIPGASGGYTALALASRIGDIDRFPTPRSLPNYFGLTPSCRNSGESGQRLGSITKEGSTLARFLLGQLVLHVLRRDAGMRAWYQRIKKRRGSKIARVAVMRRLAVIIWHMLQKRQPYLFATAVAPQPKRRRRTIPELAEAVASGSETALGGSAPKPPRFIAKGPKFEDVTNKKRSGGRGSSSALRT
jgi:transposase